MFMGGGAKGKQSDQDVTETGCLGSDSVSALAPMEIQSWARVKSPFLVSC